MIADTNAKMEMNKVVLHAFSTLKLPISIYIYTCMFYSCRYTRRSFLIIDYEKLAIKSSDI